MLEVDNRGIKSKFYGHKKILYVGQTNNLIRRISEHLRRDNSKFLRLNFPNARKELVYVNYVQGTESDAIVAESKLKRKNIEQKKSLINSDTNQLVNYVPHKGIILKSFDCVDEKICLDLRANG